VSDDYLVSLTDSRELLHGIHDVMLLNFGSGPLTSLKKCVSA
jgi:hypothetical protein